MRRGQARARRPTVGRWLRAIDAPTAPRRARTRTAHASRNSKTSTAGHEAAPCQCRSLPRSAGAGLDPPLRHSTPRRAVISLLHLRCSRVSSSGGRGGSGVRADPPARPYADCLSSSPIAVGKQAKRSSLAFLGWIPFLVPGAALVSHSDPNLFPITLSIQVGDCCGFASCLYPWFD